MNLRTANIFIPQNLTWQQYSQETPVYVSSEQSNKPQ